MKMCNYSFPFHPSIDRDFHRKSLANWTVTTIYEGKIVERPVNDVI